jgi:polar amino acid transport system substrate-binding protein
MKRIVIPLLALLFSSVWAFAADLRIITEISYPLNYTEDGTETGKLTGQSVDIVREVQKRIGDITPIEVMPWARAYKLLQIEPNVMLFSTTRTEAREKLFQWVGPLGTKERVFLAKKGSQLHVASLDDAKKVGSVGCYRNDSREFFLKEQGFTNIDSTDDPETVLKKMLTGRDDLWLTNMAEYRALAKKEGVDPSELTPVFTVEAAVMYMAFSKTTPAEVVQKWRKAFEDMKADGTYAAIIARWSS